MSTTCGPVTLAFCQDVQTEAYEWPETFFAPKTWGTRRPRPDKTELSQAAVLIRTAQKPLIIAGGGVHYSGAVAALADFARTHQIPVAETQAGKSALTWDNPLNLGFIGVTGSSAANAVADQSDLVIGAVQRSLDDSAVLVCAAGGLPGELHKLWKARQPNGYHVEYGFSSMGYEISGGMGVKMAEPTREVVVMVGDGSYMKLNSELATSVMLGHKIIVVVLDNRGFGCINRLQTGTGGASFNNLLDTARHAVPSDIDFAAHAGAMGAISEKVSSVEALEAAMGRARTAERSYVIVIDTDPTVAAEAGGAWWDVAVPEVSERAAVQTARDAYERTVSDRSKK